MFRRNIEDNLRTALTDTPVVLLNGARQVGKSTLAKRLVDATGGYYLTLDDATVLAAATSDPAGFVQGLEGMGVLDEVQKAPALFAAIKAQVDRNRRPGRFLLTGSTNVLFLPTLAESLAGRMELITLMPLSQGERLNRREIFVTAVFQEPLPVLVDAVQDDVDLLTKLTTGGFPEVIFRSTEQRRQAWFAAYVTAILQRDVRDLANITGLTEMPRLLTLLATRTGALLNMAELGRASGIPHTTLNRYLSLLETTFLLQPLPAWSANLGKRLLKSRKIYLLDSGMTTYLTGQNRERLTTDNPLLGQLLETFVVAELRKQLTWADEAVTLFHFRTTTGGEVDIVMEDAQGRLVGIEIKAAATVNPKDFSGLKTLAEMVGARFVRGIVLYRGEQPIPFGERYHALPVSALWRYVQPA
ncbi:MAG: ATP-binding protein [Candidatus Competibacteraceae bacterium]